MISKYNNDKAPKNNNNRAVIYARVSSKKQNDDEHGGLETQFKECSNEINTNYKHFKIIDYVSEIGSSYNGKNPLTNLNFLLNTNKNITIFIFDVSRFGRDFNQIHRHLSICDKNNIIIRSVKDSQIYGLNKIQSNNFISKSIESIQYSNMLSERVKAGLENKKQKGEFTGGKVPLGYHIINKKLKKLPHADVEINKIIKKIEMGENIKNIVEHVNIMKLFNKTTWTVASIKTIIKKFNTTASDSLNLDSLKMEIDYIEDYKDDKNDKDDKLYFIEDNDDEIKQVYKKYKTTH